MAGAINSTQTYVSTHCHDPLSLLPYLKEITANSCCDGASCGYLYTNAVVIGPMLADSWCKTYYITMTDEII
jgi:hypothetical protein